MWWNIVAPCVCRKSLLLLRQTPTKIMDSTVEEKILRKMKYDLVRLRKS
jgi:hypothetical protein